MPTIEVTADDPRLAPFANLQNRGDDQTFVTEGRTATARLIASKYQVAAILTDRNDDAVAAGLDDDVPVYRLPRSELSRLVGFKFHRGVLGLGQRPTATGEPPSDFGLGLGLIGVSDPDNVGSLLRSAACLGVRDIWIDRTTIDPLARRVTRVSMAHNLAARIHSIGNAADAISQLRRRGIEVLASTPAVDAIDVTAHSPCRPAVLLLGHEGEGLPADVQAAATHRICIAMPPGPDSLNVAVAGAILMHHLQRGQF